MEIKYFVGVDVSKSTLDISIVESSKVIAYKRISNTVKEIKAVITSLLKETGAVIDNTLFCMEYTGIYNIPLLKWLQSIGAKVWVESAVQISKSSGVLRGKNDKVDSARIALYASINVHRMRLWKTPRPVIEKLSALLSQRSRLMKTKKILLTAIKEQQLFLDKAIMEVVQQFNIKPLAVLEEEVKAIDKEILKTIKEDSACSRMFEVMMSIDGIGFVTASYVLTTTNEFINIDEGKRFSCYAGVVPFEHSSGSSYMGKARVSQRANKTVKTLLHMSALAAIQMDGDLREYYLRKVKEGKNKMSVLNAVRNKLVLRIFSCIKDDRLFKKIYVYSVV